MNRSRTLRPIQFFPCAFASALLATACGGGRSDLLPTFDTGDGGIPSIPAAGDVGLLNPDSGSGQGGSGGSNAGGQGGSGGSNAGGQGGSGGSNAGGQGGSGGSNAGGQGGSGGSNAGGQGGSGGSNAGGQGGSGGTPPPATPYTPPPFQVIQTPDGNVTVPTPPTSEPPFCLSIPPFGFGDVTQVKLDTGTTVPLNISQNVGLLSSGSIGYANGYAFYCDENNLLRRTHLDTDTTDFAPVVCDGLMTQGSRLFVFSGFTGDVDIYRSFSDAQAERVERTISITSQRAVTSLRGNEIFMSFNQGPEVIVASAENGRIVRTLTLEGYSGAIEGHVALGNELYVATSSQTLQVFDAVTGRSLRTINTDRQLGGLTCTSVNAASRVEGEPQITVDCGNDPSPSIFLSAERETPEVFILGSYEPRNNQPITVNVNRKTPLILVLSSYESSTWNVRAASDTNIQRILVNGANALTVSGPPGVGIDTYTGSDQLACPPFFWPRDRECDARALRGAVSARTNRLMSAFAGCYAPSSFTID